MKSSSELLQGLRCLSCERLSSDTDNLRLVDDFFNRRNDGIAQTLRNEAFAEDEEGSTAYMWLSMKVAISCSSFR